MSLSRKLTKIKDEIAEATANKTRLEGAQSQNMKQLADEFDCSTLKEAEKLHKKLEKQSEKAEAELTEKTEELEEKYGDI